MTNPKPSRLEPHPCPFCGESDIALDIEQSNIRCRNCEAEISLWDGDDVVAAWNRRSGLDAARAEAWEEAAKIVDESFRCSCENTGKCHKCLTAGDMAIKAKSLRERAGGGE